jgi:hypothetical protein
MSLQLKKKKRKICVSATFLPSKPITFWYWFIQNIVLPKKNENKYKKCQLTTNPVQHVNVHKSHPYCRVPSQPKIWILFLQYQYEFTISLDEFCVHIAWYIVTHFHYYHLLFCNNDKTVLSCGFTGGRILSGER